MRFLSLFAASGLILSASVAGANTIDGTWTRGDGNARVRIAPCGDKVCATNIWIGDTSGGEEVGDRLIMTLSPEGSGRLSGTAYDPKRQRSYNIVITSNGQSMSTKGCILGRLLCREVTWTASR